MSAASVIQRVRSAGGEITLAADGIKLKVPASLRDEVIVEVRAHKDAIKRALKGETDDPWDADDYRCFYDERAGIAEFDGGLNRGQAEAAAFEAVVSEWLDQHCQPSPAGRCAWCRRSADRRHAVVPIGTGNVHTWLHPECWPHWYEARIGRAVLELAELGVRRPTTAGGGGSLVGK